jgi:hypothetical protein
VHGWAPCTFLALRKIVFIVSLETLTDSGNAYFFGSDTNQDLLDNTGWVEGKSAGGILIGGALNEAPEIFPTELLVVPFLLDPLTLMAYSLLPLTSLEYLEWGSPCIDQDFNVMK